MMQEPVHHHSFSASNSLCCSSPIFKINPDKFLPVISPVCSPSVYMITNYALDNHPRNIFFNSNTSLNDFQILAGIDFISEEPEYDPILPITSKSVSKSNSSQTSELNSLNTKQMYVPITVLPIKLQNPPVRLNNQKRKQRGKFDNELISYDRFKGNLKFYHFKNRFGFIQVENEQFDAFLCEDDLLLSNQNLKRFKNEVYKKNPIKFEFNVKKYINSDGEEKKKAVNIDVFFVE